MSGKRIAIAGFQHETNTFSPARAAFDDFQIADSWPEMLLGEKVVHETVGLNLPIAGAAAQAFDAGNVELVPILWCAAEPCGFVTDDAFSRIRDMILAGIADAGQLDGIYLDLHGAMVTESHHDGEAALLAAIRDQFGDVPLAVSLDLHANISADFVDRADIITIYRTYPHLDMAETGARAMQRLLHLIEGATLHCAFRQVPFLLPLNAQHTAAAPCARLYGLAIDLPETEYEHAEIALGFTAADIPDCGPSLLAYASTQERADAMADRLLAEFNRAESSFDTTLFDPDDAVRQAMRLPGPVVLADVQDNPGAGGSSDTTGILAELVRQNASGVLLGVVCDGDVAAMAHQAGVGAILTTGLGGKAGPAEVRPFGGAFQVLGLSDGNIPYEGEMYGGGVACIGPTCLLRVCDTDADIRIVVSSTRTQCLDRAFFTHFALNITKARIICVKSTVHFRADFDPVAQQTLSVAAPGLFPCRLEQIAYRHVRRKIPAGRTP